RLVLGHAEHPADDQVGLVVRVAGLIERAPLLELPRLAGEPRRDAALDAGEIRGNEPAAGAGADKAAHDAADDGERLRGRGSDGIEVAREDRLDRAVGVVEPVGSLEILNLCAERRPSPGARSMECKCTADATIIVAAINESLRLRGRRVSSSAPQLQHTDELSLQ